MIFLVIGGRCIILAANSEPPAEGVGRCRRCTTKLLVGELFHARARCQGVTIDRLEDSVTCADVGSALAQSIFVHFSPRYATAYAEPASHAVRRN